MHVKPLYTLCKVWCAIYVGMCADKFVNTKGETIMFNAKLYIDYIEVNQNLPHVSKYHREGYLEHYLLVVYALFDEEYVSRTLRLAAYLHDIAKPCFYGHEEIMDEELSQFLTPDDADYGYVKALILCHGLPYKVLTAADYMPTLVKSCTKILRKAGSPVEVNDTFIADLMRLHQADDKVSVRNDADLKGIEVRCEEARRLVSTFH